MIAELLSVGDRVEIVQNYHSSGMRGTISKVEGPGFQRQLTYVVHFDGDAFGTWFTPDTVKLIPPLEALAEAAE